MAKSKVYKQDDDSKVSFEFGDDGKLIGIKKDGKSLDPQSQAFEDLQDGDDALEAYNINKFKGNIDAYEDIIDVNTDILIAQHEREEKKENNAQFLEDNTLNNDSIAFTVPNTGSTYEGSKTGYGAKKGGLFGRGGSSDLMAYPLDIDLEQDHFKITRYNYVRPDINQSKPRRKQTSLYGLRSHNVAGDSVIGSKIKGSIILPMPKPTDVNGAEWGKSELTVSGLAALGVARCCDFWRKIDRKRCSTEI